MSIHEILDIYRENIKHNNLDNYYLLNDEILTRELEIFRIFIKDKTHIKNEVYMYIKSVYYYCSNDIYLAKNILIKINCKHAYNLLGYIYSKQANYPQMEKFYIMAINMNNTNAMLNYSIYFSGLKLYDNAEKYLKMAIRDKKNINAYEHIALFYENRGNINKAIYYYSILTSKRNDADSLMRLAKIYKLQTNYPHMLECYNKIINDKTNYTADNIIAAYRNIASFYLYTTKDYPVFIKYATAGIYCNSIECINMLLNYCISIEGKPANFSKYVFYPKILTLIIANKRRGKFIPEELMHTIIYDIFLS